MKFIRLAGYALACLLVLFTVWFSGSAEPVRESEPAQGAPTLDQPPVEPIVRRDGQDVHIELTAQVSNVEISEGVQYNAWTFNGTVPGPVLRVKEGDVLHFTLSNMDPHMPHSMDFHAVQAAPSKKFIDVQPNEKGSFTYAAATPGVFMYHCGTSPVLMHVANGMHGLMIVEPKNGYATDALIDREYTLVQSEWYREHDEEAFLQEEPEYVVFNGDDFSLKNHPLLAKAGDRVRLYVSNSGPNEVSSFHVVGATFDIVYMNGHPKNKMYGLQTVLIPAGGSAVVEFTVNEEGDYPILTHQLKHASKGATAILRVTRDGQDTHEPAMAH